MKSPYEAALDDAAQDVLGYFDGLGIPPIGERQRDDLIAQTRKALDQILTEWCGDGQSHHKDYSVEDD